MKQDTLRGYLQGELEMPQKALLTAWDAYLAFTANWFWWVGLRFAISPTLPKRGCLDL